MSKFNTPRGFFVQVYEKHLVDYGYITALVYARVVRFCESIDPGTGKPRNKCYATPKTIGNTLGGIDRKTLIKALRILVDAGWLECERRPGRSNIYRIPKAILLPTYTKSCRGVVPETVQQPIPKTVHKRYKETTQHNDITVVVNSLEEQSDSQNITNPPFRTEQTPFLRYAIEKGAAHPEKYVAALKEKGVDVTMKPRKKKAGPSNHYVGQCPECGITLYRCECATGSEYRRKRYKVD